VKPAAFAYHRVADVGEAIERLAEAGGAAKAIAGGQSLVAMMNLRLVRPDALVDVSRLDALRFVRRDGDALTIGALARHWDLESLDDAALLAGYEALPEAARLVGHYPIRRRGTFGGSIAHADPASEWCMAALALDAIVVAAGPKGRREIPIGEFFHGFFATALADDELLVEVRLPRPRHAAAIEEFARRHGDFAVVAAMVAFDVTGGVCTQGRVVLGGVDATPVRVTEAEALLDGAAPGPAAFDAVADAAAAAIDPPADGHASADDRRAIARTMVVRALSRAHARAADAGATA
jgi:carbon-monoxide dehydrogenase medium subunit